MKSICTGPYYTECAKCTPRSYACASMRIKIRKHASEVHGISMWFNTYPHSLCTISFVAGIIIYLKND